jgi:hypothetical protein
MAAGFMAPLQRMFLGQVVGGTLAGTKVRENGALFVRLCSSFTSLPTLPTPCLFNLPTALKT